MMDQLNLLKAQPALYKPPAKTPVLVEVPAMQFLTIVGQGDPNTSPAYKEAVSALFSLAYALKFKVKKSTGPDYSVMPLEGLWWVENYNQFSYEDKSNWNWKMMIRQPDFITSGLMAETQNEVVKKKGLKAVERIQLENLNEGLCAQVMHIGPYAAEKPTVDCLHAYIVGNGYQLRDKHHEIYLKDPSKSAPDKLLTVLRQPVIR